ncbi:MAG: ribosome recycling factor [Acidobacteriota bacterium]|nr:ribosome recycling factor [Acidobacteriota bacterium]MDH3525169.1 ribosome recycling factor [Acidobacteriota bacterium]
MIELFREVELKMKHAVDHLHEELKHLRTGRASIAILDGLTADAYGTPMPLNQLANLSVPDPTMILAQPFDPSTIGAIERAIQASDLGLNPSNDGKVIRIPVPPLTEERRKEFVKKAHDMAEATRNVIRLARRDGNDRLKAMERDKEIGQDDEHRGMGEVQKLHDHYIAETNKTLEHKEADILTV